MPQVTNTKGSGVLIVGDLVVYVFALIISLVIRYGEVPTRGLLFSHLPSFSLLFIIFILVSFSSGLYDKQSAVIRGSVRGLLIKVQVVNVLIGIVFFYFAPVAIAPKANLFIYFIVSTILLFIWRQIMYPVMSTFKKQPAILVGDNQDVLDLFIEINSHPRYSLAFTEHIVPHASANETVDAISKAVQKSGAMVIVADLHDAKVEIAMPLLYSLIFSGVQVLDASKMYESVFDRIPLSMVKERWLVENSATALGTRRVYDAIKRMIDVIASVIGGIISLAFYPFVYVAIKWEDRGSLFISQERIGRNGKHIKIMKFRSMSGDDQGRYGSEGMTKHRVTRVGTFLRRARIDELPQFWNVFTGDLSMVGPRPELPPLVDIYEKKIPYYNARHLVEPGLFGWAQIYHEAHPHHAVDTNETRNKLSYDLYYIKNRSLLLDIKIILRTLQILTGRSGR